ncbi:hypothetical protein C8F01DRAFT_1294125 [Mycena amicta]|nr:hypothetical protein C8F01DRAFT_1294125 [Mycena amicta]
MPTMNANSASSSSKKAASAGRQKKAQQKAKSGASGPARKKGESDIKGKRRELLENHLAMFPRVAVVKNGKRKFHRDKGHWNVLHNKFWAAFPWRLPLDQEPLSDDEELQRLAADPTTPEEEEEKRKIMDQVTKKYQWWIARHEGAVNTGTSVFSPWIERLRRQAGPPPHRIADSQFYMQHPDHRLKVLAELEKRHPVVTRDNCLKLLNCLVKEMLEDEPQDIKNLIRAEVEKDHTEALNDYEESLEVTAEDMDAEDKAEARDRLASVTIPLLDELENHTEFALVASPTPNPDAITSPTGGGEERPAEENESGQEEDIGAIVERMCAEATGGQPSKIKNPVTVDAAGLKLVEDALRTLGAEFLDILPHVEKPRYKTTGSIGDYPPALCLAEFWNPVGPLLRAWVCNPDLDATRSSSTSMVQQWDAQKLAEEEERLKDGKQWLELRKKAKAKAKRRNASTWGGANTAEGLKKKRKRNEGLEDDSDNYVDDEADVDEEAEKLEQGKKRRKGKAVAGTEKDEEEVQPRPRPKLKRKARSKAKASGEKQALLETNGSWAEVEKKEMVKKEWGAPWQRVVDAWWTKEQAMGFADAGGRRPTNVFATKGRPEELAWWIGRGRNGMPDITDAKKFGQMTKAWWHTINPLGDGPKTMGSCSGGTKGRG